MAREIGIFGFFFEVTGASKDLELKATENEYFLRCTKTVFITHLLTSCDIFDEEYLFCFNV